MIIEKRIRALVTDIWGDWLSTTEAPPYVDTDTAEYRADNGANIINIEDVTRNVVTVDDGTGTGEYITTGDGYFDDLMESINLHLKGQYNSGRITGTQYAQVYTSLFQAALSQSMQFAMGKRAREIAIDKADIDLAIAESTKQDKIDTSAYKTEVEETTKDIAVGTETDKIAMVGQQLAKLAAETSYVDEQETQLINSVGFNNEIKALDALADVYGTFGAGGLTLSTDMWNALFTIVSSLSTAEVPTSTTVSKVV